jgi:hypothetical protein
MIALPRSALLSLLIPLGACTGNGGDDAVDPTLPDADAAEFRDGQAVDNPYFPLPVGATWVYEAESDEGLERIEIEVLDPAVESKTVNGVVATVVEDTVYLDGEIIEYTHDWYAQDTEGNVWYLGEDTCEFEPGTFDPDFDACEHPVGAWEWGRDGALPGIVMLADPQVGGDPYYQEYYPGEAEDYGQVVEAGITVEVAAGAFDDCIVTLDASTLDLDLREHKSYCRGIGTTKVEEPDIVEELTEFQLP